MQYLYVPEGRACRISNNAEQYGLYTDSFSSCVIYLIRGNVANPQKVSLIHVSKFTAPDDIQREIDWIGENYFVDIFLRTDHLIVDLQKNTIHVFELTLPSKFKKENNIIFKLTQDVNQKNAYAEITFYQEQLKIHTVEKKVNAISYDKSNKIKILAEVKLSENLVYHPQQLKFDTAYKLQELFGSLKRADFYMQVLIYADNNWKVIEKSNLTIDENIQNQYLNFLNFLKQDFGIQENQISTSHLWMGLCSYMSKFPEKFIDFVLIPDPSPGLSLVHDSLIAFARFLYVYLKDFSLNAIFLDELSFALQDRERGNRSNLDQNDIDYCNKLKQLIENKDIDTIKVFYENKKTGVLTTEFQKQMQAELRDIIDYDALYRITNSQNLQPNWDRCINTINKALGNGFIKNFDTKKAKWKIEEHQQGSFSARLTGFVINGKKNLAWYQGKLKKSNIKKEDICFEQSDLNQEIYTLKINNIQTMPIIKQETSSTRFEFKF